MKPLVGVSRVLDEELRTAILEKSDEEKEDVIQKLGITHLMFQNWLDRQSRFENSKKRNQLIHLLGM